MKQNGESHLKQPLLGAADGPPGGASPAARASPRKERTTRKVTFNVRGMSCASCAASIETVVAGLKGVESVHVAVLQGQAVVQYCPEEIDVRVP